MEVEVLAWGAEVLGQFGHLVNLEHKNTERIFLIRHCTAVGSWPCGMKVCQTRREGSVSWTVVDTERVLYGAPAKWPCYVPMGRRAGRDVSSVHETLTRPVGVGFLHVSWSLIPLPPLVSGGALPC